MIRHVTRYAQCAAQHLTAPSACWCGCRAVPSACGQPLGASQSLTPDRIKNTIHHPWLRELAQKSRKSCPGTDVQVGDSVLDFKRTVLEGSIDIRRCVLNPLRLVPPTILSIWHDPKRAIRHNQDGKQESILAPPLP